MKPAQKGLFLILSLASYLPAFSQHSPGKAEQAVIQKAFDVIVPVIDSFANADWEKTGGGATEMQYVSIQDHPDVVMGVAPFDDWHFHVSRGSAYYYKRIKPLEDQLASIDISSGKADKFNEYLAVTKQIKSLSDIDVEVVLNDKNLPLRLTKGAAGDLGIAGTAFAYKEKPDNEAALPCYFLVFGNWVNAALDKRLNVYQFHFVNALGSPHIENIVIKIAGTEDRIKEICNGTNWKRINEALSL